MRRGDFCRMFAGAMLGVVVVVGPANAQTTPTPETESWQFAITAYGYVPAISGAAYFPVPGTGTTFNVSQADLVNNLKMVFMGAFDAHHARWGFFTDVLYLDLGRRNTNVHDFTIGGSGIPATTTSDVSLDMKTWIANAAGEYRVFNEARGTLDVLVGMRYLSLKERLEWNFTGSLGGLPPAARAGNEEISSNIVDGIVGVKGQLRGDSPWMMPFYLDVGTGGTQLTWQGAIGLAYVFHWGELGFLYRAIDFRFDSSKLRDLTIAGPMVAATFRW